MLRDMPLSSTMGGSLGGLCSERSEHNVYPVDGLSKLGLMRRKFLEMLAEGQALALVERSDRAAVKLVGPADQSFIDEPADDLAILYQKRHLVRADL